MKRYAKAITALLSGLAAWGTAALIDETISQGDLFGLLGVVGAAIAVYFVPNEPSPTP